MKISKEDFKDWHPRHEMAGYNSIHLWVELDFEIEEYIYVVTLPGFEFKTDRLWCAIDYFNEMVNKI